MKALIRSLERRDTLTYAEVEVLTSLPHRMEKLPAHTDLVLEGSRPTESCLILSGMAARYNLVSDGRRQISAVHVAGDFVDLHSFMLESMDHSVTALSNVSVAYVPHSALLQITKSQPHLTRLFWLLTLVDAATHRQWLTAAGRLAPTAQLARFLSEVLKRMEAVGLVEDLRFDLPMNQATLADALGLSTIHVHRTVQDIRRRGLVSWAGTTVTVLDRAGLERLGEFDPSYLNLDPVPR